MVLFMGGRGGGQVRRCKNLLQRRFLITYRFNTVKARSPRLSEKGTSSRPHKRKTKQHMTWKPKSTNKRQRKHQYLHGGREGGVRPSPLGWRPPLLGWRPSLLGSAIGLKATAIRCEVIAIRLENRPSLLGSAIRLKTTAIGCEAIAIRLENIANRLETIAIRQRY